MIVGAGRRQVYGWTTSASQMSVTKQVRSQWQW